MTIESRELALYAINNDDLYRTRTTLIIRNLARKQAANRFDRDLAVKAFGHAATDAAKRYAAEFGGNWSALFKPADRKLAAEEMLDHYAEQIEEQAEELKR